MFACVQSPKSHIQAWSQCCASHYGAGAACKRYRHVVVMQYGWFALCYVMGLNPNLVPHPEASRVLGAIVSLLMTSVEELDTFVKIADIVPGMCALPCYSVSAAQMLVAKSGKSSSLCALQSRKPP